MSWGCGETSGLDYFTGYPLVLLALFAVNVLGAAAAFLVAPWRRMLAVRLMLVAALADALLIVVTVALRDRWSVTGAGPTLRDTAVCAAFFVCAGYFSGCTAVRCPGRADVAWGRERARLHHHSRHGGACWVPSPAGGSCRSFCVQLPAWPRGSYPAVQP